MTNSFASPTRLLTAVGVVLLAVAFAACSPTTSNSQTPFDQRFIDMMVPHHEGAVEMAKIAKARAQHSEIQQMADAIINSQSGEIAQMKGWRKDWYGSDQTPPMAQMPMVVAMAGHGGSTMDMAADVESLRKAGEPFDRAFIDAMIPHHQSAIDAAREAQSSAQQSQVKQMAQAIITDQQREIDQMKSWSQNWFPGDAQPTSRPSH